MGTGRILAVAVVAYLAIAIPLYWANSHTMRECEKACLEQGFDLALNATAFAPKTQCTCFNSLVKEEKAISIG